MASLYIFFWTFFLKTAQFKHQVCNAYCKRAMLVINHRDLLRHFFFNNCWCMIVVAEFKKRSKKKCSEAIGPTINFFMILFQVSNIMEYFYFRWKAALPINNAYFFAYMSLTGDRHWSNRSVTSLFCGRSYFPVGGVTSHFLSVFF